MALLMTNPDGTYATCCAICDAPLSEPVFATTHFIHNQADGLYDYSDAGMHWNCYATWKYQRRFANQYFDAVQQWKPNNPHWAAVAKTDDYLLSANPNLAQPIADIDFKAIGPGFRVAITNWTDWINGGWDDDCVHDLQRYAMIEIEAQLKRVVPDSDILLALAKENLKAKA